MRIFSFPADKIQVETKMTEDEVKQFEEDWISLRPSLEFECAMCNAQFGLKSIINKSSPSFYLASVKSTVKILSIFVVFLENVNFNWDTL